MKRVFQILCIAIFTASLFVSCNTKTEKKGNKNIAIDLSTQVNYEKFLNEWGITIPENATFKELKKTNDGNYKIFYSIAPFENMQDSLQSYYENLFDSILLDKGWVKPESGWNPRGTVYEKEDNYFKFFIVVSEKHQIYELAFKYGQ